MPLPAGNGAVPSAPLKAAKSRSAKQHGVTPHAQHRGINMADEAKKKSLGDLELMCEMCKKKFKWPAASQAFMLASNLDKPKRCPGCRDRHRRKHATEGKKRKLAGDNGALRGTQKRWKQ